MTDLKAQGHQDRERVQYLEAQIKGAQRVIKQLEVVPNIFYTI